MRPEDRLRDAIHEYTDSIGPPDAWGRIRERTAARRRVPWWVPAVAGAVLAAVVFTAVVLVRSVDEDRRRIATDGRVDAPEQIVAVTEDGAVVVLDTATGDAVRTLADGADVATTIAVAPDGQFVYFDRPTEPDADWTREIVRVPTAGGDVEVMPGSAKEPALSPDGRLLAFVVPAQPVRPDDVAPTRPERLLVVEIPETFENWTPFARGDASASNVVQEISGLSFAPDSRSLLYDISPTREGSYHRRFELGYGDPPLDQRPIVLVNDGVDVQGHLGTTGELLAVRCDADGIDPGGFRPSAIALDPTSGNATTLFRPPVPCGDIRLAADASGAHVVGISDEGRLLRWSEGAAESTELGDGYRTAAWVPEPPPPAPEEIVAATEDGRVVVLDATTGAELHTLAPGGGARSIGVSSDGQHVFLLRLGSTESEAPTELATVPIDGGPVERLIDGSGEAVVSPNGELLAVTSSDGRSIEVVEVSSLLEGAPNVVGDGSIRDRGQAVFALSWAADSRHLAFVVVGTPESSPPRVAEVERGVALESAPPVPVGPGCAFAFFLGETGLMIRVPQAGEVDAIDPVTGDTVRDLFTGPDLVCDQRLVSDQSGRHVLYTSLTPERALYVWHEGDAAPTRIADGILSAAWIPVG